MNTQIKSKRYEEVEEVSLPSILSGNAKLDKLFTSKGGLVIPSTILLTGSSGAGKTTFSKFMQSIMSGYKTMLRSREMPGSTVKGQTSGIVASDNAYICDDEMCATFPEFLKELDLVKPQVLFFDSLHAVVETELKHTMGEANAIVHVISTLRKWGKDNNAVIFIIGHVTKDDEFRGANTILQYCDAHLEMINHKKQGFRTIGWAGKNRFGDPTAMLYYDFKIKNDEIIGFDFLTEAEFNAQKKTSFTGYLEDAVNAYCEGINKNNKNYPLFKEEFWSIANNSIFDVGLSRLEESIEMIKLLDVLLKKYDMVEEDSE